jgi:hypothetical protein
MPKRRWRCIQSRLAPFRSSCIVTEAHGTPMAPSDGICFSATRELPSTTIDLVIRINISKLLPAYLLCGTKIVASSF